MTKIFCILLLPNENKNKNVGINGYASLLGLSLILPETLYFFEFFIFKIILTQLPNPTHIFWFFLDGFDYVDQTHVHPYPKTNITFEFAHLKKIYVPKKNNLPYSRLKLSFLSLLFTPSFYPKFSPPLSSYTLK